VDGIVTDAENEARHVSDTIETWVLRARRVNQGLSNDRLLTRVFTFQRHVVSPRIREYAERATSRVDELGQDSRRRTITSGELDCGDSPALDAIMRLSMQAWLLSAAAGTVPVSPMRCWR
jgi:hypothetical protein